MPVSPETFPGAPRGAPAGLVSEAAGEDVGPVARSTGAGPDEERVEPALGRGQALVVAHEVAAGVHERRDQHVEAARHVDVTPELQLAARLGLLEPGVGGPGGGVAGGPEAGVV